MFTANPLHVASLSQQMARTSSQSEAIVFNRVAVVCMGVVAIASVLQALQPLLRELTRRDERGTGPRHR